MKTVFPHAFTNSPFFNPRTLAIKSREATLKPGLTLQQSGDMMRSFGVRVDVFYGDQLSESSLRNLVTTALSDPNTRLVINFDRQVLDQLGSGHFSPLAAYDSRSDSVLIIDVAKFKYPPFWVSLADLLKAMNTTDPDSARSRGLVRVTTNQEIDDLCVFGFHESPRESWRLIG